MSTHYTLWISTVHNVLFLSTTHNQELAAFLQNTNGRITTANLAPLKDSYFGFILFIESQHEERRSTQFLSGENNNCFWLNVHFYHLSKSSDHKIIFLFYFVVVPVRISITVLRLQVAHIPRHNFKATVYVSTKCSIVVTLWTLKPLVQHY